MSPRAATFALLLAILPPRLLRAEEAVRYKFQDYRESGGRIAVRVHAVAIEKAFGTDQLLKLDGIVDSIAGATPTGEPAPAGSDQVPLSHLSERREAWNASFSRQFPRFNLALGLSRSRESDYLSTGWSLNTLADFNRKNTTLLLGLAGTTDDVRVFHQVPWEKKRTLDLVAGVTQLLDPRTSLTFNFTWGRADGYLSDPYKLVSKTVELLPGLSLPLSFAENRPDERKKIIAFASFNRAFPGQHGAMEISGRWYHDTYGVTARTLDLAWFQHLGDRLLLRPSLRLHEQEAASFYHYRLDGTSILPAGGPPRRNGPYYSSDYRLSALRTVTWGAKLVWEATAALQLDATFERYDMRGTDRVTPQSAYCSADIVTLGARLTW